MTAEITILRRNRVMEKTKFLKKIQQNKQEVIWELKKENRQAWEDNRIVYVDKRIYIPNNKKIMTL